MSSSKNISRIFYSLAAICILLFAFFSFKEIHNIWMVVDGIFSALLLHSEAAKH
jgi:hypothetical protein